MCCIDLQCIVGCVAVCVGSELHGTAVCCSVLQCVLLCVAGRVAVTYSDLQRIVDCVVVCCSVLR